MTRIKTSSAATRNPPFSADDDPDPKTTTIAQRSLIFSPILQTISGRGSSVPTGMGALSYFVGLNAEYPLDSGLGIKGWYEVQSEAAAQFIDGDVAMLMERVTMTDKEGRATKVDKGGGYKKDAEETPRILPHHSSLPHQP